LALYSSTSMKIMSGPCFPLSVVSTCNPKRSREITDPGLLPGQLEHVEGGTGARRKSMLEGGRWCNRALSVLTIDRLMPVIKSHGRVPAISDGSTVYLDAALLRLQRVS